MHGQACRHQHACWMALHPMCILYSCTKFHESVKIMGPFRPPPCCHLLTVVAALVCEVLCCGECDTWCDDALDGGVVRQVQEEHGLLQGAVLLKVLWIQVSERGLQMGNSCVCVMIAVDPDQVPSLLLKSLRCEAAGSSRSVAKQVGSDSACRAISACRSNSVWTNLGCKGQRRREDNLTGLLMSTKAVSWVWSVLTQLHTPLPHHAPWVG